MAGTDHAFPYFLTPLRNQGLSDCQHKQSVQEFSRVIQYFSLLQQGCVPLAPLTALEALDFHYTHNLTGRSNRSSVQYF